MRRCDGVAASAAAIETPVGGTPGLVGYFVTEPGKTPSPAGLAAYASAHLPDYMVPSLWMRLDALPLTPNGKLDRKSLPRPDLALAANDQQAGPAQAKAAAAPSLRSFRRDAQARQDQPA